MKFRYYITELLAGMITGTDDAGTVESLRHSEEHFIVDTELGQWVTGDAPQEVLEIDYDY